MKKKVIQHWYGFDSYGRSVERAERHDGQWFARYNESTVYGMQWCKWYKTNPPEFQKTTTNEYTGEVMQVEVPFLCWGFNRMNKYPNPYCRLPKPPIE